MMKCRQCQETFEPSKHGSPQEYCSVKCRMRAYRVRVAKKRNVTQVTSSPKPGTPQNKKPPTKISKGEVERLKQEVLRLSRQLASVQRPHYSMAIIIDKVMEENKPVRYVARHANGNEWDHGPTPKEAVGGLVLSFAISRPVTVESVEFSY